jgi:hypothetical protein
MPLTLSRKSLPFVLRLSVEGRLRPEGSEVERGEEIDKKGIDFS